MSDLNFLSIQEDTLLIKESELLNCVDVTRLEKIKELLFHSVVGDSFFTINCMLESSFNYVSENIERLLGCKQSEFTFDNFLLAIHPDDRHLFIKARESVLRLFNATNERSYLDIKSVINFRIKKSCGRYINMLSQMFCICPVKKGSMLQYITIYTDITNIKKNTTATPYFIGYNNEKKQLTLFRSTDELEIKKNYFSSREREILDLLWQGLESREIAEKLFICKDTVDTHRRKMLRKSGARNTIELIRFAIKYGYINANN